MQVCGGALAEDNTFDYSMRYCDSLKNILHTQTLTEKRELEILGEIVGRYASFKMDNTIVYAPKVISLKITEQDDVWADASELDRSA